MRGRSRCRPRSLERFRGLLGLVIRCETTKVTFVPSHAGSWTSLWCFRCNHSVKRQRARLRFLAWVIEIALMIDGRSRPVEAGARSGSRPRSSWTDVGLSWSGSAANARDFRPEPSLSCGLVWGGGWLWNVVRLPGMR